MKNIQPNTVGLGIGLPFMPDMVRALLDGLKTQTRRLQCLNKINKEPHKWDLQKLHSKENKIFAVFRHTDSMCLLEIKCPYGQPGNIVWVREEHYRFGHWIKDGHNDRGHQKYRFVATGNQVKYCDDPPEHFYKSRHKADYGTDAWYKRNSLFMPRAAARLFINITGIRCEKLKDISDADAVAEGIYRWPSLNAWFAHLRKQAPSKKTLVKEKICFLLNREKELRKKLLDGPVYRLYITSLEVPLELAITNHAKESFITLFLSINDQRHINMSDPLNNPWLWALNFEILKKTT